MKILHLSDTTLSGSPIRINDLLNKYADCQSRHMVWEPVSNVWRKFKTDLISSQMSRDEVVSWLEWADVIHYHNRWKRQKVLTQHRLSPPKKPSVIQIHSPRFDNEKFDEEVASGTPLAVIAQYHVREWPELKFIVPNVVDIHAPEMIPDPLRGGSPKIVSYAPSNCTAKGWNDKGYPQIGPILKKLKLAGLIQYQLIVNKPHDEVLRLKRLADVGIDEIITGSYHLSSLEYLSLDVPCFANLDDKTEAVVKELTGATSLPWLKSNPGSFKADLFKVLSNRTEKPKSRQWMESFWHPDFLVNKYLTMYGEL